MNRTRLSVAAIAGAACLALAVPFAAPHLTTAAFAPAAVAPWEPVSSSAGTASGTGTTGTGTSDVVSIGQTAATSATVTDDLSRGVVLITVTTSEGEGAGTGMVLTASGQVLTNYHVVEGSTDIEVTVAATGDTYAATVVGHDASRDVALLQLEGAAALETVAVDDETLAVGDALTAVGNAEGGGELVAASGVVTGLGESVTVTSGTATETLTGVIETNAGAVPGDSGGPMFDAEGEVAGMTTAGGQTVAVAPGGGRRGGATLTTVSYAVPIDVALDVVAVIRTGEESGTVEIGPRGYLGVSVQASQSGLVVAGVESGGPAASAGIAAGSVITSVGGTAVSTHAELASLLGEHEPGDKVKVTWTDAYGTSHTATVTLGTSPIN